MSRSEVRIDSDGRRFVYLEGSNIDRYSHLDSNRHCYTTLAKDRKNRQKKQERYCVVISVIISIASIVSFGFLYYYYASRSVKLADDFCVPCDKVEFHHENEKYKMLEKDYENGVEVCCASTPQSTSALMDLISERKLTEFKEQERNAQIRYGYFKGSQISAHILMSGNDTEIGKEVPVKLIVDRKLSHMNGINITKDRIVIFAKGKYFVYSQMYFKVISDLNLDTIHILSYLIKRMNKDLPNSKTEELLDSKSTVRLKGKDDHDFSTKFMSGIFELKVGDQLFVVVSNISRISRQPERNFIGLFLLG